MPPCVRELDDLVLDRWAVARATRADRAAVHRRFVEMALDDLLDRRSRPRDPAGELAGAFPALVEREAVVSRVAVLALHLGPVNCSAVHPGRGAGLEASPRK